MPSIKINRSKKLKIFLISIIFIILGIVLTIFTGYRRVLNQVNRPVADVINKANVSLDKVHQTSTKNGIKEWNLDAASVQYNIKERLAIFRDISVIFYLKDKNRVRLTAKKGILNTDSNDIKIIGNVVIENKVYTVYTDALRYLNKKRVLFSEAPVKIKGDFLILSGNALSFDLNTDKISMEGNIKGTFSVKTTL